MSQLEWYCLREILDVSDVNNLSKQDWLSFKQKSCFVCVSLQPQRFVFVNHRSTVSNKVYKVRRLHLLAYCFFEKLGCDAPICFVYRGRKIVMQISFKMNKNYAWVELCWHLAFSSYFSTLEDRIKIVQTFGR